MEQTFAAEMQTENSLLYVRNLTPYFNRENAQISFRQQDAGFARHDPQYNKISLYLNGIPSQVVNKNGICEWQFSIPLRNLELEPDKFFRVKSLRRYYRRADKKFGYFASDAGYAIVRNYNEKQYMNLFVNELPSQTQSRDGVLQYRLEVLLADRRREDAVPSPQKNGNFPSPPPCSDESPEDDIPF